ncbi:MAG: tetratricopeptide repeat protein [Nonlabens sp.]|nr:tetratricopeptide repeat protein [Nonlabens sp.]
MNSILRHSILFVAFWSCLMAASAQRENVPKQDMKRMKSYDDAVELAQQYARKNNFNQAEAAYKTAIAMQPDNPKAIYNLGNLYYDFKKEKRFNAVEQYKKALIKATSKEDKHRIYHNMGNAYLENKQYAEAVASYKQSLRNDPTDDETRYNLALAKQEQDKNGGGGGGDDGKNKDKNKGEGDSNSPQNKEGDKDQNADGKNKGDKNEKDGNDQDGGDGDKKDSDKGKNTEGENGDGKPNDQTGGKAPKRVEGKLTPQQVKQLLDAMNNEEQKVQNKINGKKAQGRSSKNEKDW